MSKKRVKIKREIVCIYTDFEPYEDDFMDVWDRIYINLDDISEEYYYEAING